ncbi:Cytochrome b2, mitochondrial precursor [Saitozyma podzolica]|uniref:L-lactate dehydrogenase (cytochrome) n=1 Tax=Saitozyma podzolica TaxID=1890683 RepID=A0A427XPL1_9TREE|nr:Cytochrome b2, mitochondrial precursor [Saitozyma podzolica]
MSRTRLAAQAQAIWRGAPRSIASRRWVSSGPTMGTGAGPSSFGVTSNGVRYTALAALGAVAIYSATHLRPTLLEDERLRSKQDHLPGTKQPGGQKLISYEEVQKHTRRDDCWVIIDGKVYDVTDFLENHPGGEGIILANAGKDATKIFKPLHPPDALDILAPEAHLGPVDPLTMPEVEDLGPTDEEKRIEQARKSMPGADAMLLIDDFEVWAEKVLSGTAWNYYRSAADREISFDENMDAFRRYYFRPRILHDVTNGDLSTTFMGIKSTLPIFISPAAMAKLGHPAGEVNLTKGAGECGIVQGISINASCSLDEIMAARKDGQKVIFQIYLNKDRKASEALLQKVERLGAAAVMFTVDAAYRSKRTRDVRAKSHVAAPIAETSASASASKAPSKAPLGVSAAISGYQDTNLTWDDIKFIRKNTKLPIIVKGVQSVDDVQLCVDAGVEGVIISNHGGRQLDFAPAPVDILYEMRANRPELFEKIEVMVDGGVRSGADVVKALALGAKAVGLGRPFLYANGTHGQEGVERVCQIMAEEITNTMRNCGARTIKELKPEMVGPAGPWVGQNRPTWLPKA